jgi:hypothetical protein
LNEANANIEGKSFIFDDRCIGEKDASHNILGTMIAFRKLLTLLLCVAAYSQEECIVNNVTSCDDCSSPGGGGGPEMTPEASVEADYGLPQIMDNDRGVEMQRTIADMKVYFQNLRQDPTTSEEMHELLNNCKNKHEMCTFWKVLGECEKVRNIQKRNASLHPSLI